MSRSNQRNGKGLYLRFAPGEDGTVTTRMVLSGCLLLAATGCGVAGDTPAVGSSSPATRSSSAPSSFTEDLTVTPPPGRGGVITVRGIVESGVESGCLLLGEGEGPYVLVGHTSGLAAGDTVTVRGAVMTGLATTCQQGQPLWVDEVLER
jgi:hypothetical protein